MACATHGLAIYRISFLQLLKTAVVFTAAQLVQSAVSAVCSVFMSSAAVGCSYVTNNTVLASHYQQSLIEPSTPTKL